MEDFPEDLLELEARFSTETACGEYPFRLRWPDGFCCPRCGGRKTWPVSGVLLQCSGCNYQSSVTAGTIFQDTRTADGLVPGRLVGHQPEERCERHGPPTCAGAEELQDRLDVAA